MHKKKLIIGALALALVLGGTYAYSSGELLQGKFGLKTNSVTQNNIKKTTVTETLSTPSPHLAVPYLTIDANSSSSGSLVNETSTDSINFGRLDLVVRKDASNLQSCAFGLDAYNKDAKYEISDFFENFSLTVRGDATGDPASAWSDTHHAFSVDFTSLSPSTMTSGMNLNLSFTGTVDPHNTLTGATTGDTSTYEANTVDLYLSYITCTYKTSSGNSHYTWIKGSEGVNDINDSDGNDPEGYFSFDGTYVSGKGMSIHKYVITN